MASPLDLTGLILGVIGLVPILLVVIRYQLPQHKLKQLDATLDETISLLESAVQHGFVPSDEFVKMMRTRLLLLREVTESLRICVFCATGFLSQVSALRAGLSKRVDLVRHDVKTARKRIAKASDQEKRRKATEERSRQSTSLSRADAMYCADSSAELLELDPLESPELMKILSPILPTIQMPLPTYSSHSVSALRQHVRPHAFSTAPQYTAMSPVLKHQTNVL